MVPLSGCTIPVPLLGEFRFKAPQGPGQQGLSQTVACKQAGASLIIVTGTSKDAARMAVAAERHPDMPAFFLEDWRAGQL